MDQEFQTLAGLEKPTDEQGKRLKDIQSTREKALEMLKAHGWAPSAAPVLPQSEWKRL